MFFQYLRKLQLLPPEKKQMVVLFLSVTITAMIFGLWLTTLNLGGTNNEVVAKKTSSTSPFATITGAFKGLTNELSERIGQFSDQIANFQKTEVWNFYPDASTTASATIQQTLEINGN
ncbi:MAG: hypothetical protein WC673_02825 [Candidatus Paceibacterota bacterium]|jgi:hypothetical protein